MLFVDAENDDALRLYASLGFTTSRVDRAYEREA
jgi:ribosomal protein S18 acetylase RimI-like enzyme